MQTAKLILRLCAIEQTDFRLALLNWRNTPRDNLPSPSQRLFGRPTRGLIPLHPSLRSRAASSSAFFQMNREKQRATFTTPDGKNLRRNSQHLRPDKSPLLAEPDTTSPTSPSTSESEHCTSNLHHNSVPDPNTKSGTIPTPVVTTTRSGRNVRRTGRLYL